MLMMLLISPIEFLSPAHRPTALPRSVGDHSCLSMIQLNRHAYDIPQLSLVVDIEICFGRCRVRGFKIVRRLFVGFCTLSYPVLVIERLLDPNLRSKSRMLRHHNLFSRPVSLPKALHRWLMSTSKTPLPQ